VERYNISGPKQRVGGLAVHASHYLPESELKQWFLYVPPALTLKLTISRNEYIHVLRVYHNKR